MRVFRRAFIVARLAPRASCMTEEDLASQGKGHGRQADRPGGWTLQLFLRRSVCVRL